MKYTKDTLYEPIPSILSSNSGNSGNSSNSSNSDLKSTFQEKCDIFRAELFPLPPNTEPISLINYRPSLK
jgi:hypothetical protein